MSLAWAWAHLGKAEVESASLPWQVRERCLLLFLVEGAQELQVYLSVLCQQIAVLQPEVWWYLTNWYNHLDGQHTLSLHMQSAGSPL